MSEASEAPSADEGSLYEGPPVDLRGARVGCANFCRVTSSPEEFVLDFAMDCQATPPDATRAATGRPLLATHRVTLSPSTVKRLVAALESLLAHYESRFGRIEIEVHQRLLEAQLPTLVPRN
jgi:hypothetical protein